MDVGRGRGRSRISGITGEKNILVAQSPAQPARSDFGKPVRLQVNATGEAEFTILGGASPRTEAIPWHGPLLMRSRLFLTAAIITSPSGRFRSNGYKRRRSRAGPRRLSARRRDPQTAGNLANQRYGRAVHGRSLSIGSWRPATRCAPARCMRARRATRTIPSVGKRSLVCRGERAYTAERSTMNVNCSPVSGSTMGSSGSRSTSGLDTRLNGPRRPRPSHTRVGRGAWRWPSEIG